MRPVRKITAEDENFRTELLKGINCCVIRRDPVEAEPKGTIVLMAFRITGYHPDCDGSLMVKAEQIDKDGEITGWDIDSIGLYPETELVVTEHEWKKMFD